jgi:hypothetical protein
MDLQALTPLLTSLSLTAVMFVCARRHHQSSKDEDTFTIAPTVAYLMTGAGIFFCIVPFLPGASGNIPKVAFFFYFSPFWLGAFAASAFFLRYQVVVRDNTLAYGSFRRRVVPFSEVIDLDVLNGSKSSELWVYLRNGKTLKFSGMLSDFDELVGMVNSHMGGVPGTQKDSPAKIHDQEQRKHDNRTADRFMVIGLLIVAVFVFALWRMHLFN